MDPMFFFYELGYSVEAAPFEMLIKYSNSTALQAKVARADRFTQPTDGNVATFPREARYCAAALTLHFWGKKQQSNIRTPHQAIEAGEEPDEDAGNESGKNQFNYSERAAQTFNNPMRERGVVTEPPPMLSFRNTVAQWEIYDSYMAEYSAQVCGAGLKTCSGGEAGGGERPGLGVSQYRHLIPSCVLGVANNPIRFPRWYAGKPFCGIV